MLHHRPLKHVYTTTHFIHPVSHIYMCVCFPRCCCWLKARRTRTCLRVPAVRNGTHAPLRPCYTRLGDDSQTYTASCTSITPVYSGVTQEVSSPRHGPRTTSGTPRRSRTVWRQHCQQPGSETQRGKTNKEKIDLSSIYATQKYDTLGMHVESYKTLKLIFIKLFWMQRLKYVIYFNPWYQLLWFFYVICSQFSLPVWRSFLVTTRNSLFHIVLKCVIVVYKY